MPHPIKLAGIAATWMASTMFIGLADAATNAWTITGPEGGETRSIVVSPSDPSLIVVSSTRGVYRSVNGGTTWDLASLNTSNQLEDLCFDPVNPHRVVGLGGNIYLSNDDGQSFAPAQGPPNLSSIYRMAYAADGSLYTAVLGGRLYKGTSTFTWSEVPITWSTTAQVSAMGMAATQPGTVYVGVDLVGIFRSTDGGANWTGPLPGAPQPPDETYFYSASVDPHDANRVLVASGRGIYFSANGGNSWTQASNVAAYWVGFDPNDSSRATAVAVYGTVLRSIDGGVSFPQIGAELRLPGLIDASFVPNHPGQLWLASVNGPAQSADSGNTFTYRVSGIRAGYVRNFAAADDGTIYVSMNAGTGGIFRRGTNYTALDPAALRGVTSGPFGIQALAVSATDSQLLYAVNNGNELVRTEDGGQSWTSPHPQFVTAGPYDSISSVTIDPTNPLIAYASRPNTGVWKTVDGGATWTRLVNSPRQAGMLTPDPANTNTLYLSGGDGTLDQVHKSTNGGLTWSMKLDTQNTRYFLGFSFDPTNSNIVYAVGYGGIHKSVDAGETWTPVSSTLLTGGPVGALLIDPLIPSTMIAIGNTSGPGFVRTVDGGATWDLTTFDLAGANLFTYGGVLDPQMPSRVIVGAGGAGVAEYDIAPDLELSLTGPPAVVPLGLPVSLKATVRDAGPHASSASVLRVPTPGWSLVSVPAGCTQVTGAVECQFGALRVNETRSVDFTVTAPAVAAASHIDASVTGHEPDPFAGNSTARIDLQAKEMADLAVAFSGANPPLDNHSTVTQTIDVSNAGPNASTSTVLTIDLSPQGGVAALTGATFTASQGACTLAGTKATCALGTIAKGAAAHVQVSATASAVGAAQISAAADGAGDDTGSDQAATRTLTLRAVGDLGVEVTDSVDPATTNTPWQYTATVRNLGPDAGTATLAVALTGATVTSATSAAGTCTASAASVTCAFPSLASGASASAALTVSSASAGQASAAATVTFDGTDSSAPNNSATASTTVNAPPASKPPGQGGGGGRFDWLALGLLGGLLAWRRARQSAWLSG